MAALEAAGGAGCARFVGGCVRNAPDRPAGRRHRHRHHPDAGRGDRGADGRRAEGRSHRRRARHRHRRRQRQAVRDHHPAPRRRDRRPPRGGGLHHRLGRGRRSGATSASTPSTPTPTAGSTIPPASGLADARAGRIVFVGDAETRIREDALRILRFFRFHAWYGRGEPDAGGPGRLRRAARPDRRPLGRAGLQGAAEAAGGRGSARRRVRLMAADRRAGAWCCPRRRGWRGSSGWSSIETEMLFTEDAAAAPGRAAAGRSGRRPRPSPSACASPTPSATGWSRR